MSRSLAEEYRGPYIEVQKTLLSYQPKCILSLSYLKKATWAGSFLFSQGCLSWVPIESYHICVVLLAADNCFLYPSREISVSVLTGYFPAPSKSIKETEILNIVTDSWRRKTYQGTLTHTHVLLKKVISEWLGHNHLFLHLSFILLLHCHLFGPSSPSLSLFPSMTSSSLPLLFLDICTLFYNVKQLIWSLDFRMI